MPRRESQNAARRRPPLSDEHKRLMLFVLIRDQTAFESVRRLLTPEHFDGPGERLFAVIWAATLEFFETHHKLPNFYELSTEVNSRTNADYDSFSQADIDDFDDFLEVCFEIPHEDLDPAVARQLSSQLLLEHVSHETSQYLRGDISCDLPSLLQEQMVRAQAVHSLQGGAIPKPFGDISTIEELVEKLPPVTKEPTGCDFLDHYLNGGQVAGEIYGLIAPYGVGKTLLSVQLAVKRAKRERARWIRNGRRGPLPIVYLFVWEEPIEGLRTRSISCWGQVHRNIVEHNQYLTHGSRGSNPESLKPYERARFRHLLENNKRVLGELERARRALTGVQDGIRFVDFGGGVPRFSGWAGDGAAGVAAAINSDQSDTGNPGVSLVICDHADAMATTAINYHNWDDSRKRHLIGDFPKNLKALVARPMNCPVWAMHQMRGAAQTKGLSGGLPAINDSAEAKNWSEYQDFSFGIGQVNTQNLCILVNFKQRRAERRPPTVLRVDGELCTIRSTGDAFRVDGNRIVSSRDFERFVDVPELSENAPNVWSDSDIGEE